MIDREISVDREFSRGRGASMLRVPPENLTTVC
jgi:hypothetical protein